jgi:hypothetical protein
MRGNMIGDYAAPAPVAASFVMNFDTTWNADESVHARTLTALSGTTPAIQTGSGNYKFGTAGLNTGGMYMTADGAEFDLSTSNWTIDFWLRDLSQSNSAILSLAQSQTYPTWNDAQSVFRIFYAASSSVLLMVLTLDDDSVVYPGGWGGVADEGWNTDANVWDHFAFVRHGDSVYAYRNGARGSVQQPSGITSIAGRTVKALTGKYLTVAGLSPGWGANQAGGSKKIDALRIVKTALWTGASFTPPTAPPS